MSKFLRELLIGIAVTLLGVLLSTASRQYLFFGLIVVGLALVIFAFVHRNQSKQTSNDGEVLVKKFYPTDKPQEKARFLKNLDAQETWDSKTGLYTFPEAINQPVLLNGAEVGRVEPGAPLIFLVTKKNNVVNISEQYEGICFFHVVAAEGIGELKVGMGMQSAAVKIVPNTGLADGIVAAIPKPTETV